MVDFGMRFWYFCLFCLVFAVIALQVVVLSVIFVIYENKCVCVYFWLLSSLSQSLMMSQHYFITSESLLLIVKISLLVLNRTNQNS